MTCKEHWSHDVRDPIAFVARIADRSSRELDHHQRERLIQFLLIALWRLSFVYVDKPGGIRFATFAGHHLPRRIIDWERLPEEGGRTKWQFSGRTYERTLPTLVSLDEGAQDDLGTAVAGSSVDDSELRLADELRLLKARGRRPGGRDEWMGDEAA